MRTDLLRQLRGVRVTPRRFDIEAVKPTIPPMVQLLLAVAEDERNWTACPPEHPERQVIKARQDRTLRAIIEKIQLTEEI